MTGPRFNGAEGEETADRILRYEGWETVARQPTAAGGHRLDRLMRHPATGAEWLVEVKVWRAVRGPNATGTDTVKKAIADAYDMRAAGEARPLLLVLSHHLRGLLGDMLTRAVAAGAITDIRVLGSESHYQHEGKP